MVRYLRKMRTFLAMSQDLVSRRIFKFVMTRFNQLKHLDAYFDLLEGKNKVFGTYKLYFGEESKKIKRNLFFGHSYFVRRKVNNSMQEKNKDLNPFMGNIAVIIQGPILHKEKFTYRTALGYLSNFPDALVIISTWEDEDTSYFDFGLNLEFENRVHIIKSRYPNEPGTFNLNYQIYSSRIGLKKAQELKCAYSIKTRSDQRFVSPQALRFLFEMNMRYGEGPFGKRIFALNINTFVFRLYGVSDMFQFGRTIDLVKYWAVELFSNDAADVKENFASTLRQESERTLPEVYLTTQYLKSCEIEPNFTLAQSLTVIRDLFCIIDTQLIQLFWNRHTHLESKWEVLVYPSRFHELSHLEWLMLQDSFDFYLKDERVLDDSDFYLNN